MTQRLIVKFRPPACRRQSKPESVRERWPRVRLAADSGVALAYVRPMALGAHVVEFDHPVPLSEARAIARRLAGRAEVEYVQPDHHMRAQFVPNDEYVNLQTYLRDNAAGISAFSAWDIATGSANIVVAVVDTGYRPHAAMAGRILPGYDFVSDPIVANDGDGRDADATDPGDWITLTDLTSSHTFDGCDIENSSWHGTSTAGIIAANSNDAVWTAGIDWAAKDSAGARARQVFRRRFRHHRRYRLGGGIERARRPRQSDAGAGHQSEYRRAGRCAPGYQQVIASAFAHGITRAIVAVGGQRRRRRRHQYAVQLSRRYFGGRDQLHRQQSVVQQFGPTITISAPGGDTFGRFRRHRNPEQPWHPGPTADAVAMANGTSFAAPMVSGVIALMLAVAPTLTANEMQCPSRVERQAVSGGLEMHDGELRRRDPRCACRGPCGARRAPCDGKFRRAVVEFARRLRSRLGHQFCASRRSRFSFRGSPTT